MKYKPLVNEELLKDKNTYMKQVDEEVNEFIKSKYTVPELSFEEIKALETYTMVDGKPNWRIVNRKKRKNIELTESEQLFFNTISNALKNKIGFEAVVYRGFKIKEKDECVLFDEKTDVKNLKAFTSTSFSLDKALDYTISYKNEIRILLKIDISKNTKGVVLHNISKASTTEFEILLSETNNYKINKIYKNMYGVDYVFELECLD